MPLLKQKRVKSLTTAVKSKRAIQLILDLVLARLKLLSQKLHKKYLVASDCHSAIGLALNLIDNTILCPKADC